MNLRGLIGNRLVKSEVLQQYTLNPDTALLHYMTTPEVMHWTHAMRLGQWAKAKALKDEAFVEDCCCWFNFDKECKDQAMNLIELPSGNLFDQLARLYIS